MISPVKAQLFNTGGSQYFICTPFSVLSYIFDTLYRVVCKPKLLGFFFQTC